MRYASPLRYPGGKAGFTGFLTDTIDLNDLRGCVYHEPYAGGAGAALSLLQLKVVSELYLNDADPRIYAFWQAALFSSESFVERIGKVPLSIEEWQNQKAICDHPDLNSQFDVGFAAFFLNRCNRSGVLSGSGPIGGYTQAGSWRLDARFNREVLSERILALRHMKERIHLSREDAVIFLKKTLPRGRDRKKIFVFLDPPYFTNGKRLYLNAYKMKDHAKLASYLRRQKILPWIMSYDDSDLVRKLYTGCNVSLMPIRYTLQERRSAQELIIAPRHLAVPWTCRVHAAASLIVENNDVGRAL